MPHITFVKKVLSDGSLCKKCLEVSERLENDGLLPMIDHIVVADERDASSVGIKLAREYSVSKAPFFLVEDDSREVLVFDIYFKFRKHLAEQGIGNAKRSSL